MKKYKNKNNHRMFNILPLFGLLLGIFLYIFFKQDKNKKSEQAIVTKKDNTPRVQNSNTPSKNEAKLNERQQRILERIRQEGRLDPSEIYQLAPDVSTRTIRRDMETLIKLNLVSQQGSTKSTTYTYISD